MCDTLKDGKVPKVAINDLGLQASYAWSGSKAKVFLELDVRCVGVTLSPAASDPDREEAEMRGVVSYVYAQSESNWHLSVFISNLRAGLLHSLFDSDSPDTIAVLQHVELKGMQMEYYYAPKTGEPSHFNMCGPLLLGTLELDVSFDYNG